MDFGDLVASAEQLTAEIDGSRAGDLPRVERSLKHILDAGHTLIHKVRIGFCRKQGSIDLNANF